MTTTPSTFHGPSLSRGRGCGGGAPAGPPLASDELEKALGYSKGRFVLRLESPQRLEPADEPKPPNDDLLEKGESVADFRPVAVGTA